MIIGTQMAPILYFLITGNYEEAGRRMFPICCCPHWVVGLVIPFVVAGLFGLAFSAGIPYGFHLYKMFRGGGSIPTVSSSSSQRGEVSMATRDRGGSGGALPIAPATLIGRVPSTGTEGVFHSQQIPVADAFDEDPNIGRCVVATAYAATPVAGRTVPIASSAPIGGVL